MRRPESPFWAIALLRLAGVFVTGLALVVLFREVVVPMIRGDAARVQEEHAK